MVVWQLKSAWEQLCFFPAQLSAVHASSGVWCTTSSTTLARLTKITSHVFLFFKLLFVSNVGWNTSYFWVSFVGQSKVKLPAMRVSYAGLARSCVTATSRTFTTSPFHTVRFHPSYCTSTHFRVKKRPNQTSERFVFFLVSSYLVKVKKLASFRLALLTIFLASSLFSPLFFKGQANIFWNSSLSWKAKEEAVRNCELNGKNIFGKL